MAKVKYAIPSETAEIADTLILLSVVTEKLAKKVVSNSLKNQKEGRVNGKRKLQKNR